MPGYSFSLSPALCKTGSILRKLPNTPCSTCYAYRGNYSRPTVKTALDARLKGWKNDPDWVLLMTIRLLYLSIKHQYFRVFDAGDLVSVKMLEDINQVAQNINPYVFVWLPTQERAYVKAFTGTFSSNLTVRISSTKVDEIQTSTIPGVVNSSVSTTNNLSKGAFLCPSRNQQNKCGLCRACWDLNQKQIVYQKH